MFRNNFYWCGGRHNRGRFRFLTNCDFGFHKDLEKNIQEIQKLSLTVEQLKEKINKLSNKKN